MSPHCLPLVMRLTFVALAFVASLLAVGLAGAVDAVERSAFAAVVAHVVAAAVDSYCSPLNHKRH